MRLTIGLYGASSAAVAIISGTLAEGLATGCWHRVLHDSVVWGGIVIPLFALAFAWTAAGPERTTARAQEGRNENRLNRFDTASRKTG